jgi:hypothetical protein
MVAAGPDKNDFCGSRTHLQRSIILTNTSLILVNKQVMTWAPGQSGNPNGDPPVYRRRGSHRVFEEAKKLGYLDPLLTLFELQHKSSNESIRVSAATAHPKLQSHHASSLHRATRYRWQHDVGQLVHNRLIGRQLLQHSPCCHFEYCRRIDFRPNFLRPWLVSV